MNQKGFGLVEGLLIAAIVALLGSGVYWIYSQNIEDESSNDTSASTQQDISSYEECVAAGYPIMESYPEQCAVPDGQTFTRQLSADEMQDLEDQEVSDDTTVNPSSNKHFTITLPDGWEETDVEPGDVAGSPEYFYNYTDANDRRISVSVNSLGFGPGGDSVMTTDVINNSISLPAEYELCDVSSQATACQYHREQNDLLIMVLSSEKIKGNDYIFWLVDPNSQTQESYQSLAQIVETIRFK